MIPDRCVLASSRAEAIESTSTGTSTADAGISPLPIR